MALPNEALTVVQAHLLRNNYTSTALASLADVQLFLQNCYPSLEVTLVKEDDRDSAWVVVCCRKYVCIEGRPVKPARLVFGTHGMYCFKVLLKNVKVGCWIQSLPPHREICDYLETFLEHSGYITCPGLVVNFETEFGETV